MSTNAHVLPPGIVKTSRQQLKTAIRVIPPVQQQCKPLCWGIPSSSLFNTVLPQDLLETSSAGSFGPASRFFANRFYSTSPGNNPHQTVYVSFPHNISVQLLLQNLRSFGRKYPNCYFYLDTWSFPRGPTTTKQIRQRIFGCDMVLCIVEGDASFYRHTFSRLACLYEIYVAMAYKKTVFFSSFGFSAENVFYSSLNFGTSCSSNKERAQDIIASVPRPELVERAVWTAMYMCHLAKKTAKNSVPKGKKSAISPLHRYVLTKNHDPYAKYKHLTYDSC